MKKGKLNRRQFVQTSVAGTVVTAAAKVGSPGQKSPESGGKENLGEQAGTEEAVFVSDMSLCRPQSALTRTFEKDRWQLIDYQTEEGVKGAMVSARPEDQCGELTLPIDVQGPHKIYLGINYTKAPYPSWSPYGQIEVKVTGDAGFRRIAIESGTLDKDGSPKIGVNNYNHKSVQEAFWKVADLTGQSLIFRQPEYPYNKPEHANISNLSYVKLVPLTEEAAAAWQPTEDTRRIAAIYCPAVMTGHTRGTYTFHPTTREWFQNEFTPYPDSDIRIFIFGTMRGNYCLYKTEIGDVGTEDNRWQQNWVDPLKAFAELAHANGIRIFSALRMVGPQYPMNREPIAWARHYWRHPEWTKLDKDGVPLSNWSLAFPEVRRYWISLLREALAYGIDGIQLHLNRSTPFVYYEDPVVRPFQEKFGEDPRKLPHSDPRWQAHCAKFVTDYLREVRALLDEKPGRELGVTIYGEAHKYDLEPGYHPIRYNCDVETWLREGLVNYVMPSPRIDLSLLAKWREIAGTKVHLWPDLMPRRQLPESYARLAETYYEAGADGFCLWDGERRTTAISEWAAVQRLGHKDTLDRLIHDGPSYYRRVWLKHLGGFSVRESFHDG